MRRTGLGEPLGRKEGMYHEDGMVIFWEGYLLSGGRWAHVAVLKRPVEDVRRLLEALNHVGSAAEKAVVDERPKE